MRAKPTIPLSPERQDLVRDNLRLAYWWACRWMSAESSVDIQTLKDAAVSGLISAASSWDPAKGSSFGAYAGRGITMALFRCTKEHIRREQVRGIVREIARRTKKVCEFPDGIDQSDTSDIVFSLLKSLSNVEHQVIRKRYWENRSLREAGRELGLSGERVRQIQNGALAKMNRQAMQPSPSCSG